MKNKISFYSQIPDHVENDQTLSTTSYKEKIINIAQMSDIYGFTGSLVFYNHKTLDPWIITSIILENTIQNIPLVATQPNTAPPFAIAKKIQSYAFLYQRKINLNFITGNNIEEIEQLNDLKTHELRYKRLEEYIGVLENILINGDKGLSHKGDYYNYSNLNILPSIKKEYLPDFFIPGASKDSKNLADKYQATFLTKPDPIEKYKLKYAVNNCSQNKLAIRVGIMAREKPEMAWENVKSEFPITKEGKVSTLMSSIKQSTNNNKKLASLALKKEVFDSVYWTGAVLSGKSYNPYIVGSYKEVADYLQKYINVGVETILFANVFKEEDFYHCGKVIEILNNEVKNNNDE